MPGPQPDRLNEIFEHYLPDVNPPSGQSLQFLSPDLFKHDDYPQHQRGSAGPMDLMPSTGLSRSTSSSNGYTRGRSTAAAATSGPNIEAWVRKMASRASSALEKGSDAANLLATPKVKARDVVAGGSSLARGNERIGSLGGEGDIDLMELDLGEGAEVGAGDGGDVGSGGGGGAVAVSSARQDLLAGVGVGVRGRSFGRSDSAAGGKDKDD